MWVNGICMTTVPENEVMSIVETNRANGKYVSYSPGASHFVIEDKKPWCLMTKEEQKQVKKVKVTCHHCNKKQFYKNENRCRYCYNLNMEWN